MDKASTGSFDGKRLAREKGGGEVSEGAMLVVLAQGYARNIVL